MYKILALGTGEWWVIELDELNWDVYHPVQKGITDRSIAEALVRGLENN